MWAGAVQMAAGTASFPDNKRKSVLHQYILVLSLNHMGQYGPYTSGTSPTSLGGKYTSSLHCPGTSPTALWNPCWFSFFLALFLSVPLLFCLAPSQPSLHHRDSKKSLVALTEQSSHIRVLHTLGLDHCSAEAVSCQQLPKWSVSIIYGTHKR